MMFEVQYLDGYGAWRRWSVRQTRAGAERSADRCRAFLGPYEPPPEVRIREIARVG